VVWVDRNDYHQFQPLLYHVASSQLPAEDIARPHRVIFADYPSVTLVTAHVSAVTLSPPSLVLSDGQTLTGSYLVMAAGARPNFFGVRIVAVRAAAAVGGAGKRRAEVHRDRHRRQHHHKQARGLNARGGKHASTSTERATAG
jgi:NADH dehydrogenase